LFSHKTVEIKSLLREYFTITISFPADWNRNINANNIATNDFN